MRMCINLLIKSMWHAYVNKPVNKEQVACVCE